MPYKASPPMLLVILFYAMWVALGTLTVSPPGHLAIVAPLESPDGGILYYSRGSIVAWRYSGRGFEIFEPGSWIVEARGKPLAACSNGSVAVVVLAAPEAAAVFIVDGQEYWYKASWATPKAYAACGGGTLVAGFSGEARSTLIVYRGGEAFEVRVPRLYGLEVDRTGTVYAAVGDGLLTMDPSGGSRLLVYPGYKVIGVFDEGRLVGLGGGGSILIAPTMGGAGLSIDSGNGTTRVEAATLDHNTIQAYVRPPQGWGRVACTTPGGGAYSLEAAASLPFAFTAAGEANGTLWFSGIIFNATKKAMMIAVVEGCQPAMVPWPHTIYYVKRAEPDPLKPSTSRAPEPEARPANTNMEMVEAYRQEAVRSAPNLDTRVYHAYVDKAIIAFTLAALAAGPAAAAYKALTAQDMNPSREKESPGTSPR